MGLKLLLLENMEERFVFIAAECTMMFFKLPLPQQSFNGCAQSRLSCIHLMLGKEKIFFLSLSRSLTVLIFFLKMPVKLAKTSVWSFVYG